MVRKPAVAGQFYPARKKDLINKIEDSFSHKLGPGELKKEGKGLRRIKGLVVPHAGYVYSGPIAAHAYKELYNDGNPDTIILIGPSHRSISSEIALSDENFETPLGRVETDKNLVEKLKGSMIRIDNMSHQNEHSIEVQLPFLQYIFEDFKIVPICLGLQSFDTVKKLGKRIKETIKNLDTVIIASTDFSHYVLKETAEKKDKMAIDKIIENDPKGLYDVVQKENISMCGYGPVATMMIGSGGEKGQLLKYATSGDIMSMREVVGYGALSFK
ncbi:MAG: AmmeMemoRadiSam system protein B [Thermoplasmatota archaeon]